MQHKATVLRERASLMSEGALRERAERGAATNANEAAVTTLHEHSAMASTTL